MAVLTGDSHSGRMTSGDAVLEAATTTDTKLVSAKLKRFDGTHKALGKANGVLDAAATKLREAEQKVAEKDVTQDERVEGLATALVGDGAPRTQPFKGLSKHSPSVMKDLGYAEEAKAVRALVAKVRKRKANASKVEAACKAAEKAANDVDAALAALPDLEKAVAAARTRRDALSLPWEKAFAALKRGARSAADDGAAELFDTLFKTAASPKTPRAKKAPVVPPEPK